MSSKVYDFLRWFSCIFLPALTTFVGAVLAALQVGCADTVVTIMAAFTTFMNAVVGVNKFSYDKKQKENLAAFTNTTIDENGNIKGKKGDNVSLGDKEES